MKSIHLLISLTTILYSTTDAAKLFNNEYGLPPATKVNKNVTKPLLVYATTKNIWRREEDSLSRPETLFRMSDHSSEDNITALSVSLERKLIFWSDTAGNVRRMTLEKDKYKNYRVILRGAQHNLSQIHHLSVDWLNEKLYIAGTSKISRCDLGTSEGTTGSYEYLIETDSKPLDMHVDPVNGYLFYSLAGPPDTMLAAIYRTDLSKFDKLANIPLSIHDKAQIKVVISDPSISVFTLDYNNFRIYYPLSMSQGARGNYTTIMSSDLEGGHRIDMRAELVVTSQFETFHSIVHLNKVFAWTDGPVLYKEEYQVHENKYYHNSYFPHTEPIVALSVWHPEAQPYPVPPKAPHSLKSLFLTNEATVIWSKPKLIQGRSEGSWQDWEYEIMAQQASDVNEKGTAKSSSERAELKGLIPGVEYIIRVRAVSPAGVSQWSDPLINRTLKAETAAQALSHPLHMWGTPPVTPEIKEDDFKVNKISWSKAESFGAPTVWYELQIRDVDSDNPWRTVYNGTHLQFYPTLANNIGVDHAYNLRLKARSQHGEGPFSKRNVTFYYRRYPEPITVEPSPTSNVIAVVAWLLVIAVLVVVVFCVLIQGGYQHEKKKMPPSVNYDRNEIVPQLPGHPHQSNVLYVPGCSLEDELGMVPSVRSSQIEKSKYIGSGAFGKVFRGFVEGLPDSPQKKEVAIKTLKEGATSEEKVNFLKEAKLMSNFKHPHIIDLFAVCLDNGAQSLILELMEDGDLLTFLRNNKKTEYCSLTMDDLIAICVDVAKGCYYLEDMHFIHNDLAARGSGLMPIRWMSPEAFDGVFTIQSDVWSFGVLLWEVMTLGERPYPSQLNPEVLNYVRRGGKMKQPEKCPKELYELMEECWSYQPQSRPSFATCLQTLIDLRVGTRKFLH